METITETSTVKVEQFTHVDPLRVDPMPVRGFAVAWMRSEEDLGLTDGATWRNAFHEFSLDIWYPVGPAGLKWLNAHEMIMQDRHDLLKQLEETNLKGYDASNTTTDIGLETRHRVGDELDRGTADVWVYRSIWRCLVREDQV
jgi:hypothetical protein